MPYFSELEQSSTSLVEEESKPVEAKKISSPDTTVNKNNSNGAVQTGSNTYSVIALAVIALLSFTAFSQLSKQRNKFFLTHRALQNSNALAFFLAVYYNSFYRILSL